MKFNKLFLFGLVLSLLSVIYFLTILAPNLRAFETTKNWKEVQGEIVSSSVVGFKHKTGNHKVKTLYKPLVKYTYNLDSKVYVSSQLFLGSEQLFFSESKSTEIVSKYKIHDVVSVFYSTVKKERAVLDRVDANSCYFHIFITLLLTIFGFGFLFKNW